MHFTNAIIITNKILGHLKTLSGSQGQNLKFGPEATFVCLLNQPYSHSTKQRMRGGPGGGGGGGGVTRHMTGYTPRVQKKASKGCVSQPYSVINIFL